jgi:hypothetical protein
MMSHTKMQKAASAMNEILVPSHVHRITNATPVNALTSRI